MANATIPVIQINEGNVGIGTTTPLAKLDIQGTQGQLFSVTDNLSGSIFAVADISGVPIFDVNSSSVSYFDGNVGIGETTPNCKLDVKGVVNTTIIAATTLGDGGGAANRGLAIRTLTDGGEITTVGSSTNMYLDTANNLYLQNAGNTKVTMLANGNVGIGTTNPLHDLQIGTASTNGSYSMMIEGNFANTALSSNPRLNLIDTNFGITAGKYGSGASDDAIGIFAYQGAGRGILFAHTTAGSGTTLQNMRHDMFVDGGTGNVGIGTTNPEYGLSVLTDDGGGVGNIVAYDNAPNAAGVGGGIGLGGYYNATQITPWAIIRAPKDTGGNGNFAGALTFSTRNSTSFNEAMRISSAGAIKFNAYGAGTLVTDASGNITAATSGAGTGTVTSITKGAGLVVAGSPITTTGSVAVEYGGNVNNIITGGNNFIGDTAVLTDQILITDPGVTSTNRRVGNIELGDLPFLPFSGGTMTGAIIIPEYITHAGDTDTKFGFTAANQFQVIAGGNTNLNVQGNGVDLSYAGSTKLTTQTGGIAITGDLTVTADVGIGLTNPDVPLHVTANEDGSGIDKGAAKFINTNTGQGATTMHMVQTSSSNFANAVKFWQGSTPTAVGFIRLTTSATQFITSASDLNLKKNITNWSDDTLSKFKALEPKKFRFKTQDVSEDKTLGFIAQNEVDNFPEAYPQFLGNDEQPYYGFNPTGMVPHLMKAIKDLVEKVETLENRITQLENNN